jgi:fatty acid desaturase
MRPIRIPDYARALRGALPREAFRPRPLRLAWLPLHVAVAAASIVTVARGIGGLPVALALAPLIAHSFACMAFVSHELLHGAMVRSAGARQFFGWLGFLPFLVSPRLWVVWHNKVHHAHTMEPGVDPDSYPSLDEYHASRALRVADQASLGRGHALGFLSLVIGYNVQSAQVLFGAARKWMSRLEWRLAFAETMASVATWALVGAAIGPRALLLAWVVPMLLGNMLLMSYILTNHSLSPYTDVNDPLLNSLSVTVPRWLDALHLQFGYHVEHHLFPSLSGAEAPALRRLLVERWPERYQSLPLLQALRALASTPRIHLDATTLVDPRTGAQFPTLGPGVSSEPEVEGEAELPVAVSAAG